ncbi:ShlB/FhaC/HecB family hemolysin secretion/activation protein [Comamonas sp. GB3 AK4-5]|uniref:ShlB/FhaC/HecB family hemolysin secretion/activation protein n=1 Tax=Comamonas sp. GB3 AK4-5 TaxID=3231487 RepID=UPI00351E783F
MKRYISGKTFFNSCFRLLVLFAPFPSGVVNAQQNESTVIDQQQLQRQQERERALRERLDPGIETLRPAQKSAALELPADEKPCFPLQALRLTGEKSEQVPWLQDAAAVDFASNPCIGVKGVGVILERMQQAILERGYVTSRVMVAPQNLQQGVLAVEFIPGVLHEIRFSQESTSSTSILTALPSQRGELLQLRDIEQGLENLKRIPTADADIQIVPAEGVDAGPGQSDLVISYKSITPLRFNLALDNGGSKSTGKTQGTATLSWDNPLGLNDLMYLSLGSGVGNGGDRGTKSQVVHYSLPLGYWQVALTGSQNKYHQGVAGAVQNYTYSGESSNLDLKLSRVIFRSASSKTTAGFKVFHRTASNYIDDTEVEVQRRRTSGYELSLGQRSYLGSAVLDANLAFKRGTGAFDALAAPEEPWGEGTSRMKLFIADLALTQPFELAGTRLKFSSTWHGQWNKTPLTPQDRIAIGGRYTVRGFDGESSLMAERGWYWRNELGMPLGASAEAFIGLDTGHVSGPSAQYLVGQSLTGAAIGVRGAWRGLSYEVSWATPIQKPEHFRTSHSNFALNLAYSF